MALPAFWDLIPQHATSEQIKKVLVATEADVEISARDRDGWVNLCFDLEMAYRDARSSERETEKAQRREEAYQRKLAKARERYQKRRIDPCYSKVVVKTQGGHEVTIEWSRLAKRLRAW